MNLVVLVTRHVDSELGVSRKSVGGRETEGDRREILGVRRRCYLDSPFDLLPVSHVELFSAVAPTCRPDDMSGGHIISACWVSLPLRWLGHT